MKFLTVIGARPQFIKAGPLSSRLRSEHEEVIVHTGQHYDYGMSQVFFEELGIPVPDHSLNIGSGSHGAQTGAMLAGIEKILEAEKPELVLVYGDTNSTIAGALAAAKLHIPVAHVEAGLRSFNRAMPEEINRIVTDHLSTWLFPPSEASRRQLASEGITENVFVVGDIMHDVVLGNRSRAAERSRFPGSLRLEPREYYFCTIHRAENSDQQERLCGIFAALERLDRKVVLPLHPRSRKQMELFGIQPGSNVILLEPVGYLDSLQLQQSAACILTDSGGVQKEAYYLGIPCVTLRNETEWTETVDTGWNRLCGADPDLIVDAVEQFSSFRGAHPNLYGSGDTADLIANTFSRYVRGADERHQRSARMSG